MNQSQWLLRLITVLCVLSGAGIVFSQNHAAPLVVDYANFIAPNGLTLVEFYLQIGYGQLHFVRHDDTFQAAYDIALHIETPEGRPVRRETAQDAFEIADSNATRSPDQYRITLVAAHLPSGNYRLRAVVADQATGQRREITRLFSARDFNGRRVRLSDLQFSRKITPDTSRRVFVKNNFFIEPNVLRRYGRFAGQLAVYYEIYHLLPPSHERFSRADSFEVALMIFDANGNEVKQWRQIHRKRGDAAAQSLSLLLADLANGEYTLTVWVTDLQSMSSAEASGRFEVSWQNWLAQKNR